MVSMLPLDRIVLETDAPFQTPHPFRGKRNEPAYVCLIADKIGMALSRTTEEIASATTENARLLFNWD
jgi:TatD DNase family protein